MSHNKRTKAETEYVRAIIQNLSLKRLTDQEIVEYLHNEKQIEIARSTVTNNRLRMERRAAKWYLDIKASTTKYIAAYKERIDSLLSYQKLLHEITTSTKKDEVKIRAVSELHSIEKTIFDMWKQLPSLEISDQTKHKQQEQEHQQVEEPPLFDVEDLNGREELPEEVKGLWHSYVQCDGCKRWWSSQTLMQYHKKKSNNNACAIPNVV